MWKVYLKDFILKVVFPIFMLVNIILLCYINQLYLFCCCASWMDTARFEQESRLTALGFFCVKMQSLFLLISDWLVRRNQQKSNWQIQNFPQQIQNLNSGARSNYHSEQMHRQKGRALLPPRASHQYSWVSDTHFQSPASQWVPNRYGKSLSCNFHISATPRPFPTAAASDWGWK